MKSWALKFTAGVILAGLLQTAALAWMVYDRVSLISDGRKVVLKNVPVDPRDLFRGDYVILNYEAAQLDLSKLSGDDKFTRRAPVYVVLAPGVDEGWQPVSVHKELPEVTAGQAVLRGIARGSRSEKNSTLRVNYKVGRLFVPEGEGKVLEKKVREGDVYVVLAVADDGEAAVKALIVDGERIYEESLF